MFRFQGMASAKLRDFLESSTIHGLVHISTAKSKAARAAWVAIVVACFAFAIHMITSSYNEWQESPVSTTITTHPITELKFPTVTVCPPRGSNTAINHLLEKVKDVNFTEEERQELLDISKEVFLEIPNKKYASQMAGLLSMDNMKSIANEQASMHEVDEEGMIILKSSEPESSFPFPSKYFQNASFKYELNFPEQIGKLVGGGELVVSIETTGDWVFFAPKYNTQLHEEMLTMYAAEQFCADQGGQLATVVSQWEHDQLNEMIEDNHYIVWLGGKRRQKDWEWLDGRPWTFQNWMSHHATNNEGKDCVRMVGNKWIPEKWVAAPCNEMSMFICENPLRMTGSHKMSFKNISLTNRPFHFWFNSSTDVSNRSAPEFKLNWQIENGSLPDVMELVSKDLEGSVSTPGLGSLPPPNYYKESHEYTAVIELPHNITDVFGDAAMVIDINIVPDNERKGHVELLIGEPKFEYNNMRMTWSAAEEFCVSKGGHLASVASHSQWQKLKDFMARKSFSNEPIWLGGTNEANEGEWNWTDGSKWSADYWKPGRPIGGSYYNCLYVPYLDQHLFDSPCNFDYYSICSLPTVATLQSSTQVVHCRTIFLCSLDVGNLYIIGRFCLFVCHEK